MSALNRTPQLRGTFTPGDPASGYYNDLRIVAHGYGVPHEAAGWFEMFALRRERALPVSMLQLALGSWQIATLENDPRWLELVRAAADWAVVDMDGHGRFAHHQPMPHTYEIEPPWFSAMAQGQGASLLVRAAATFEQPDLLREARRAIAPLLAADSQLVATTDDGLVLQEYPSTPPAHVLNGWIWALWGLYDVAVAGDGDAEAREAFDNGVETLAARLPLYETARGWSRYDLYPHPVVNVASPFYHRLHIEQLRALNELAPREAFTEHADRWQASLASRTARLSAVARKVRFRMVRPRRKAA